MEKDHKRDENLVKLVTQLDLLFKLVMGGGLKIVNAVGTSSYPDYPRHGGNKGSIKDRDNDYRDWRYRAGSEGNQTEEILTRIFTKVEGPDKVFKDLKNDFSTMNQTVTSHSLSIKHLETPMHQISLYLNPRQKGTLPRDTIPNHKNDC
ncbi:hypothetical protein MTR67_043415 [Solanum verrucosum]|uniref:Uncharacterized protein n=1 Tax=Solanum verrucosum TaxID=315347 RepID=A0AAF0ZUP1_SOLVR|nr:hypothetical protein MTR67_043415 [Solanum verrucosum]